MRTTKKKKISIWKICFIREFLYISSKICSFSLSFTFLFFLLDEFFIPYFFLFQFFQLFLCFCFLSSTFLFSSHFSSFSLSFYLIFVFFCFLLLSFFYLIPIFSFSLPFFIISFFMIGYNRNNFISSAYERKFFLNM